MATSQEFSKVVTFNQNMGGLNFNIIGTSTSTVTFNDNGSYSGVWRVYSDCWFTAIDANGNVLYDDFGQPLNRWYFYDNGGGGVFTGSGDQYTFSGMASDGTTTITGTGTFSNNRTVVTEAITLGIKDLGNIQGVGSGHYDMDVIGDESDNTLEGSSGFDSIEGGGGNDSLIGDSGNDDLLGGDGNDTLVGGFGNDDLFGGVGNDAMYLDAGSDFAMGGDGTDTVYLVGELTDYSVYSYTASAPVEASVTAISATSASSNKYIQLQDKNGQIYTINGVENVVFTASNQTLSNDANGLLKGAGTDKKDTINGTAQADYVFAGAGDDKVFGKEGADEIDGGTGKDALDGGLGNDRLDGGAGDDALTGGAGNDTFIVDSAKDKITEKANEGNDTVIASVSYTLANNLETLNLTGTYNINATGNAAANTLIGNASNNSINGGLDNDTLTGGAGADTFVFNSKLGATNVDSITDFASGIDKIALDDAVFTKLKGLSSLRDTLYTQRIVGESTQDANDYLFYDFESGRLYYDADGSGSKSSAILIATVGSATDLSASDFVVV